MKRVAVIGEGAWGSAIATLLAANNREVLLWCHDKTLQEDILKNRINNRYLPGIILDKKIIPVVNPQQALDSVDLIFEAIPVKFLRTIIMQFKPYITSKQSWVILSKGIENDSLLFPSQIVDQVAQLPISKAVLGGPSFAHELAHKQPTAVTLAAHEQVFGNYLQKLLANDYFKPYLASDMIGVQTASAFKNVIALAIGMLDGAGYGDNTKCYVLTRSLQEIATLIATFGGDSQTVYGLAGLGDIVLTAMGRKSRNREVGRQLGLGKSLDTTIQETGFIPEGVNTVTSLHQLMQQKSLQLPICSGVYNIIVNNKKIDDFVHELMKQPLEKE